MSQPLILYVMFINTPGRGQQLQVLFLTFLDLDFPILLEIDFVVL